MRKIHPREEIVTDAEMKLRDAVHAARVGLTEGEYLRVISTVFGDTVSRIAKYMIRDERHPDDPDKPGGLE